MKNQPFIDKLIKSTEKSSIKWYKIDTLKNDSNLNNYLALHKHDHITPLGRLDLFVEPKNSFYFKYKNGFVFLFEEFLEASPDNNYFILGVQQENSKVVELNNYQESQPDLLRLFNLIEEQINNVTGLINAILHDNSI